MPTISAPSSNTIVQYFNTQWISKNSAVIKPEVRAEAYKKYGKGIGARDFIFAAGKVIDIPNQTITVGLKESPLAVVTTHAEITTGSAGGDVTMYLASTCFDANGNGPLRVGDTVLIPKTYQAATCTTDREYWVSDIGSGAKTSKEYTLKPFAKDGGFYTVASQIATAIPAGTVLSIVSNAFAVGTDQPAGLTDSWETRTFKARESKESVDIEGGQIAQSFYEYTQNEGNGNLLANAINEAEFRLDVKEARAFFHGEANDNSTMTQTSESGVSTLVVSGAGMWPTVDLYSQGLSYSGDFIIDNLYDAGMIFESKGVVGGSNMMFVGPELGRDVEAAALDYIKAFSGGTDLLDKVKGELGAEVTAFKLDGRVYQIMRPKELVDPTGLGLNINGTYTYALATAGLIIPDVKVSTTLNGKMTTLDSVQLGYVNHNGENRRRIMKYKLGMHGLDGFGNQVSSGYDGLHIYLLTHYAGIFPNPDNWIKVTKS